MSYTIPNNCIECGTCKPLCPTGAIQIDDGQYWIEPGLCDGCQDRYSEPQCVVHCPIDCPTPLQAKKGRYKAAERIATSPDLFSNGKNNPFASSMVIWEACKLLSGAKILPWKTDANGKLYYQRAVKHGRGAIAFRLSNDRESDLPQTLDGAAALPILDAIDIRSACLHLIYAAYATTLEKPWEQEFIISDLQIEKYLGLDKRKDLTKATKLTLIKILARQPCQLLTTIDWPQQGKVEGFSVEESRLWHLGAIHHHFQQDESGHKHLMGITFRIRTGRWAEYFLNKQSYRKRTAFYQYGTLPQFLLSTVMSIWQQHQGAVRMMLWLLFKVKMGQQQCITVPTLMRVGYGKEKILEASLKREHRKRLVRTFESDLEVLNYYGLKPIFDPATYQSEIQPLWAKLDELPEDAEEALEFWTNDGSGDRRLTDSGPRGKWDLLMKARILGFELPSEWAEQLAKLEKKKQQKTARKTRPRMNFELSAEEIQTARKHRGISQRDLAKKLGKSQSWIRDLENGRFCAKLEDQLLLRKLLGLS